jgi:Na+/H+-dicarboxylate symporter
MAEGNMLQIIVFSLLFGIALKSLGSAGEPLKNAFELINDVILSLVRMLIELAPYGIFALLFSLFAVQGFGMIGDLAKYFFFTYFCFNLPCIHYLRRSIDSFSTIKSY